MNLVILSGGSGARLWPLSNENRSKQFLKLLKDEHGNYQSMVQRVYGQIRSAGYNAAITVSTSEKQVIPIKNQLGDAVDVIVEPSRRNTFPAIALVCSYLYFEKGLNKDEPIVVLPVDPYADMGYFHALGKLVEAVESNACNLALMGVKPTYPSSKYGYLISDEAASHEQIKKILRFKEKPTEDEAVELIHGGALWNCGVFAFKLGYIINILLNQISADSYKEVYSKYECLPKDSFDYVVSEKEACIAAIEYDGYWMDLGSWNTLTERLDKFCVGNVLMDHTNNNTHVLNELGIPMIVMGANNMIIAASYDGILVADKHQSSYMKPLVEQVTRQPMYEERQWGDYRVLDYILHKDGRKSLTRRMAIRSGANIEYKFHCHRDEIWTITTGAGEAVLDDKRIAVKSGDVIKIPQGTKHGIRAQEDMEIIEVQIGMNLEDEDNLRVKYNW